MITPTPKLYSDKSPQLADNLNTNAFNIEFDNLTGILDDDAKAQLLFAKSAVAVNYLQIANSGTGNGPSLRAKGFDTNVDLVLAAQGTGVIDMLSSMKLGDNIPLLLGDSAIEFDGSNLKITPDVVGTGTLIVNKTEDTASTEVLRLIGNSRATATAGDETYQSFYLDNDAGVPTELARITVEAASVVSGSERATTIFQGKRNGVFMEYLRFGAAASGYRYLSINNDREDIDFRLGTPGNTYFMYINSGNAAMTVGSSVSLALLGVDGIADKVQLLAQAHTTQTNDIFVVEDSAGADIFNVGLNKIGFYGTASITKQTGVAVTAAGVHAALVNLGLIAA